MRRPVFSFRPNMDNPEHRKAWEILQGVPEGQKNQFVVSALLKSKEGECLERIVRQAVREEMRNAAPLQNQESGKEQEEIPEQMLGFLEQLGGM